MVQQLSEEDLVNLKSFKSVFKLTHILFLIVLVPVSLLAGIFGINSFGYFQTAGAIFIIVFIFYLFYTLYKYWLYYKDLRNLKKISSIVTIVNKQSKGSDRFIVTDDPLLKRIEIIDNEIFDVVNVGERILIEQTLHSKYLLKIEKQ